MFLYSFSAILLWKSAAIPEAEMEQAVALAQLLVAGSDTGPAIDAGNVAFMLSRCHVHEASPVAALAIRASRDPRNIHIEPKRNRVDPAEKHLHEPCRADEPAEHVTNENRSDEHIHCDADDPCFDAEGELPVHDLAQDRCRGHEIPGEGYAPRERDDDRAH